MEARYLLLEILIGLTGIQNAWVTYTPPCDHNEAD